MGWKVSMIIAELKGRSINEKQILKVLGWTSVRQMEERSLAQCLLPADQTVSIGYYRDCAIICDDFQFAPFHFSYYISPNEKKLQHLFMDAEVLTIACHSSINFHGYALAAEGRRQRYKQVSHEIEREDFGDWMEEEREIYDRATFIEGVKYWKMDHDPKELYEESQLMEEFTFRIGKRLLGVNLIEEEGEYLLEQIPFHPYKQV
ncbi:MAG: hypothetical protein AAF587_37330 [Bacteroidota bacterium]